MNTAKIIKTTLGALSLSLIVALSSCQGAGQKDQANDTIISAAMTDSLSQAYGNLMGTFFNNQLVDAAQFDTIKVDKQQFMRGLSIALTHASDPDVQAGLQAGFKILADLDRFSEQGINLDRATVLRLIKQAMKTDSARHDQAEEYLKQFEGLLATVNAKKQKADEAKTLASPKAKANFGAGLNYAQKYLAETPAAKQMPSGVVANIERQGTAITDTTTVKADAVFRHIDGREINKVYAASFTPQANMPGFAEALMLTGMGGKATFIIPPQLAFGANGMPDYGVGPQEWIIFEIEIIGQAVNSELKTTRNQTKRFPAPQN